MNADTIIVGGSVLTVNRTNDIAQAVAVRGNRILAVGTDEEIRALAGEHTKVIDASGCTVMPGLVDAHIHFGMYGMLGKSVINVAYSHAKSIGDILRLIREDAAKKPKGTWIKLQGYDHSKLQEGRHPTVAEIDKAAPDHPVQCTRCCAHMGVYNTQALNIGGIRPEQFAPGEVITDETGALTGLLKETAHMHMSTLVEYTDEEVMEGLSNANNIMLSLGVTSAHEAGCYGAQSFRAMRRAAASGVIQVRLYAMIFDMLGKQSCNELIAHHLSAGTCTGLGDTGYRLGPIKLMLDGSSSGPSSATRRPYSHDPNLKGILVWQPGETEAMVEAAHRAGYQVTAHAVGDQAVEMMVTAIENALAKYPRPDHRHRIEHCALTDPALIERIKNAGIIPISNPAFITINGRDYNRYYGDRVDYMFSMKSYQEAGVITAIGSDSPVTHPDPMHGFYGALTRKDRKNQVTCGEGQKLDILDVVRMHTYNGAYASFEEDIKGSLEPGKLADITVLSEDILLCPPDEIGRVSAKYTMVGGNLCYSKV